MPLPPPDLKGGSVGGVQCGVCTFINKRGAITCEMCEGQLIANSQPHEPGHDEARDNMVDDNIEDTKSPNEDEFFDENAMRDD
jgi:hypothetical protein